MRSITWLLRLKVCLLSRKPRREPLSVSELEHAGVVIVKSLQAEYRDRCGDLRRLNPIVNEQGILGVGGRLSHAPLQDRVKHP